MTAADYIFACSLFVVSFVTNFFTYRAGIARGVELEQDRTHARHAAKGRESDRK